MKYTALLICGVFLLLSGSGLSQLSWSGYTSSPYNTGTSPNNMEVTVTTNQVTPGDGTPKYTTSTSPNCYIAAGSLALYAGFFNSYTAANNSNFTVTIKFNKGYSGTCNRISFQIRDLNSDESTTTFCDVVEISAVDGANNPVVAASIATTTASFVTRSVSGNVVKLVGHSNASETVGAYTSGTACGTTTVTITPPTNEELKTVTIKYRPAYGTSSSNAYCSTTTRPAAQYISIGNITLTSNGSCTILPVKLTSFSGYRASGKVELSWETATEQNNDYFAIERTADGETIEEIAQIGGAGNSSSLKSYNYTDRSPLPGVSYYRLRQTDFDGKITYYDWISITEDASEGFAVQQVAPNPAQESFKIFSYASRAVEAEVYMLDQSGRVVGSEKVFLQQGSNISHQSAAHLERGIYTLKVMVPAENYIFNHKIVVE